MNSTIDAVIFDFFDVLHTDYQKAWLKKNGYAREGEYAAASDDLDRGKIGIREYFERYAAAHGNGSADDLIREFREVGHVDTEVVAIILELRELGYKTGLVSNAHGDELRPLLEEHNFFDLFDEIVISGDEGVAKPDPKIFELIINRLGTTAEATVFIDDNEKNVLGSQKAGMNGILFTKADKLREDLQELQILP